MATYYVSDATGNDGDDGLSPGDAWATIDHAMNTVVAGDKVWVKADGDYDETVTIDTVGTTALPIVFAGYTTTPGDGGQATIDGEGIRTNCLTESTAPGTAGYYVFWNFIFTNATVAVGIDLKDVTFKNCTFSNASGDGVICSGPTNFENCLFDSNGTVGLDGSGVVVAIGCKFINNTAEGIEGSAGIWVFDCTFVGNGADAIECLGGAGTTVIVLGCTVDGDAKTTNTGIDVGFSFWRRAIIANNLIYDCTLGVQCFNQGERFISRNNLLNNNTTDYTNFQTFDGEVTAAPQFTDEAGGDYSLSSASPARDAGFDGYLQNGSIQRRDIGAIESTPAGGLLTHPGTSGGARG